MCWGCRIEGFEDVVDQINVSALGAVLATCRARISLARKNLTELIVGKTGFWLRGFDVGGLAASDPVV